MKFEKLLPPGGITHEQHDSMCASVQTIGFALLNHDRFLIDRLADRIGTNPLFWHPILPPVIDGWKAGLKTGQTGKPACSHRLRKLWMNLVNDLACSNHHGRTSAVE
jgi:hypothetical protein